MTLSSILPGLREVRAPLLAGYLYVLVVWLWFDDDLEREQSTGAVGQIYDLVQSLPTAALLAAVSVAAYLVGSLLDNVRALLAARIDASVKGRLRLSHARQAQLKTLINDRVRSAWADLRRAGLEPEYPTVADSPTPAQVVLETEALRNSMVGVHPELLAEIDRHRSESELRSALVLPLFLLITTLGAENGWIWGLGYLAVAGIAVQAIDRMRAYNSAVLTALETDRATSPALASFNRTVEDSIESADAMRAMERDGRPAEVVAMLIREFNIAKSIGRLPPDEIERIYRKRLRELILTEEPDRDLALVREVSRSNLEWLLEKQVFEEELEWGADGIRAWMAEATPAEMRGVLDRMHVLLLLAERVGDTAVATEARDVIETLKREVPAW